MIESNGNCNGASTLHTVSGSGSGCNSGGCASDYSYGGSASFNMNVSFSTSGQVTITRNGGGISGFSPSPSSSDFSALASAYSGNGAVIYSSLWTGWVPSFSGCSSSGGSLGSSSFTISNLQIYGTIKQGPTATLCSGSPPPPQTPAPTSQGSPPTTPPPGCSFPYNYAGHQCQGLSSGGTTTQSGCASACCAKSGCKIYQWWPSSGSNGACWIGTSTNCPANSGNFQSFGTTTLPAEIATNPVQQNYIYIIVGVIVIAILIVAAILTLRYKARSRGQSVGQYARDSVVKQPEPTETVPLEALPAQDVSAQDVSAQEKVPAEKPMENLMEPTSSLSTEAPLAEPRTSNSEWERRTDLNNGTNFWYNNSTGVSQWETPDGVTV